MRRTPILILLGLAGCGDSPTGPQPDAFALAAISVGAGHTCAITVDQALYCWGGNGAGQIGDGTKRIGFCPHRWRPRCGFAR